MIKQIRKSWKYSHVRAIVWTIVICIVSGALSIAFDNGCGAISSISASICAGCITGIVFYVISNTRNNEIQATREEYEEARKNYKLATQIMHLCSDTIESISDSETNIAEICSLTNKLITYMSTLCFDAPRTAKIIKDYSKEYVEITESASKAVDELEKIVVETINEKQVKKDLLDIMCFCSATKGILLTPWSQLMSEVSQFEESIF